MSGSANLLLENFVKIIQFFLIYNLDEYFAINLRNLYYIIIMGNWYNNWSVVLTLSIEGLPFKFIHSILTIDIYRALKGRHKELGFESYRVEQLQPSTSVSYSVNSFQPNRRTLFQSNTVMVAMNSVTPNLVSKVHLM